VQGSDGEYGADDGDTGGEAGGRAEQVQQHQGQDHHQQQAGQHISQQPKLNTQSSFSSMTQ
jgi:hypothetical protein